MPRRSAAPRRPEDHDDAPPPSSRYQHLEHAAVRQAAASLQNRIADRFPDRSLWEVGEEVVAIADEVGAGTGISRRRVRFARTLSRLLVGMIVVFLGGVLALTWMDVTAHPGAVEPIDLLPLVESAINNVVFGGIAVLFLLAVPERMERARVLRILHRLRSLAHVIDMHQLTKSPERLERGSRADGGMDLNRTDLGYYLEYCTEMLSLVGKTAALFAENTTDGDVLDAVEGLENLTSDMSRTVWQKITILQSTRS